MALELRNWFKQCGRVFKKIFFLTVNFSYRSLDELAVSQSGNITLTHNYDMTLAFNWNDEKPVLCHKLSPS